MNSAQKKIVSHKRTLDVNPNVDETTRYITRLTKGPYLSNGNLDRSEVITFFPDACVQFNDCANRIVIDGSVPEDEKQHGAGGIGLGMFPHLMPSFSGYDGIEVFALVIKRPGTAEHYIPAALHRADPLLLPLLKTIASHQFSSSPYAIDKVAEIILRKVPMKASLIQPGNLGHLDDAKPTGEGKKYGIPEEDNVTHLGISLKLHHSFYDIANTDSLIYQARRSEKPLRLIHGDSGTKTYSKFPYNCARPGELIFGNKLMFHRVKNFKKEKEIQTIKNDETHRCAVLQFYSFPKSMESHFGIAGLG